MSDAEKVAVIVMAAQAVSLFSKKRKFIDDVVSHAALIVKKKREKHERIMGYLNVTQKYSLDDFKAHFRLTRSTMDLLLISLKIEGNLNMIGRPSLDKKLQCLVAVWVLANQESYRSIADRFDVCKTTVFHCLIRVSKALNDLGPSIIVWPRGHRAIQIMNEFHAVRSFPRVIGAIDGCHIDIKVLKEESQPYVNRKSRTSMLLQGVCDHKYLFTDCFIGYPGSVHDARVFIKSGMSERCNNDANFPNDSHILGDSAYPLRKHILVPFKNNGHLTRKQIKYNIAHAATRCVIERTFGILKGRWRRLFYLELHNLDNVPSVISAACVLHNICFNNNDEAPGDIRYQEILEVDHSQSESMEITSNRGGTDKRNEIADQFE